MGGGSTEGPFVATVDLTQRSSGSWPGGVSGSRVRQEGGQDRTDRPTPPRAPALLQDLVVSGFVTKKDSLVHSVLDRDRRRFVRQHCRTPSVR